MNGCLSRRATITTAAAVVGLGLGIGSAAFASIPHSITGVITACYTTTGTLRVIDAQAGKTCASTDKKVTWNAKGPAGPAGRDGTNGVAGHVIVSNPIDGDIHIAPGMAQNVIALCPAGKKVLGGGYNAPNLGSGENFTIVESSAPYTSPDGRQGWIAYFENISNLNEASYVRVHAICAQAN